MRQRRRLVPAAVLLASLLQPAFAQPAFAASAPGGAAPAAYWPSEREARVKQIDVEILVLQRRRFVAVFARDHDRVEHLDQRMKDLREERRRLLEASGHL
jgi:hypothetical protein